MHYYQFNLSDYITATAHLTPMQDIAYRRLIDFYYEKESPIPNKTEWVSNRLRLVNERKTIEFILSEFFTLTDDNVWIHDVCDANISIYQKRCKTNKANSLKGGRPKKTESVSSGNPVVTLTNNHKPITKEKRRASPFSPPSQDQVSEYCKERNNNVNPVEFINHYEANGWVRGKTKIKSWKACVRTCEKNDSPNEVNYGSNAI